MRLSLVAPLVAVALLAAGAATAADIEVKDAWIRSTQPGAPTAAGYATIINHGITSDRLTGANTRVATSVEMHHMTTTGGVMRMRPLPAGVAMAGSGRIRFSPDGDHLMLVGLKGPLKAGMHVKITLHFQRAGSLAADFTVRDTPPASGGMHM